jgi:hypothetical protein
VDKKGPLLPAMKTRCWEWQASKARFGYGLITISGKPQFAHRVSWLLRHGAWPTLHILHRCDNPACVRPSHLFEGSQGDNVRDMLAKGRGAYGTSTGEAHGMAKLTREEVDAIRLEFAKGMVTQVSLARKYNVTKKHIGNIVHGTNWTH